MTFINGGEQEHHIFVELTLGVPLANAIDALDNNLINHLTCVSVDEDNPLVPTVSNLWKGALYPEQELFDMFGIKVEGHPKMERLIMPKDWEGFPLRKDYPLTTETVAFSHNRDFKSELVKSKPPTR